MKNKNTDGLRQELMDSPDLTQFLSQNEELFANKSVAELLTHLFEKKHISKAALAKQAGMSEIYLHQIFAGRRTPSRNRLLCLCYGLEASIEETQELFTALWDRRALSQAETRCYHLLWSAPPARSVHNQ